MYRYVSMYTCNVYMYACTYVCTCVCIYAMNVCYAYTYMYKTCAHECLQCKVYYNRVCVCVHVHTWPILCTYVPCPKSIAPAPWTLGNHVCKIFYFYGHFSEEQCVCVWCIISLYLYGYICAGIEQWEYMVHNIRKRWRVGVFYWIRMIPKVSPHKMSF